MSNSIVTQIISPHLLRELEHRYRYCLNELTPTSPRRRLCAMAKHALSAFPIAVSAWESFLNEKCISRFTKNEIPTSPIWKVENRLEKWSLEEKTLLVPQLLFGVDFDKASQPYQDFAILLKIRNYITHFRVDEKEINVLKDLELRNIVLPAISSTGSIRPFPTRLMTTEAIRWAHNTVAKMALHFLNRVGAATKFPFATTVNGEKVFIDETTPLYYEIDEDTAKQFFRQLGLDPDAEVSPSRMDATSDAIGPAIEIVFPLF
jgi:hypothetical protein